MTEPLSPDRLRWTCDPELFPVDGTAEMSALGETMGQERALAALSMGLELYAPGYNVFVSGLTGTGRTSTVKRILEDIKPHCALAPDRAYVHNFGEPDEPTLLTLPRGTARAFATGMEQFVEGLKQSLPVLFDDDSYKTRRDAVIERYAGEERKRLDELREAAQSDGLALVQIETGPVVHPEVLPIHDGEPIDFEALLQLQASGKITDDEAARLTKQQKTYKQQLEKHLAWARGWARAMTKEIDDLARRVATGVVAGPLADLKAEHPHTGIGPWLKQVEQHVLDNLPRFLQPPGEHEGPQRRRTDRYLEYQVNVLQDQRERAGCPVIVETAPTFSNLFGMIEREVGPGGAVYTDHTKIHAGSLLRADGGYLVANALDIFSEPGVWLALKRTLKYGQLHVRPPDQFFPMGVSGLKPEPIPVNVKVILIGDAGLYHRALAVEREFPKIFKVLAEFDTDIPRTDDNVSRYAAVAARIIDTEKLAPLAPDGLAALTEFGVRRAGRQNRLSVRFSEIADLLREAEYWRKRADGATQIGGADIRRALDAHRERHGQTEERLRRYIEEGVIRVETAGLAVGQVNGLAVLSLGLYAFGKPARISATTAPGRAGLINIERRARLSGSSHDKGVLILSGFLRQRFAQRFPLALTAALAFEQSYSGVDGDSASSTEVYALLSSLSEFPIRQSLAVTGSVDQQGRVQAIGGVNEKVEGFFDLCQARGLTGEQGALIPASNVDDLMLRPDVVDAVRAGTFHVYAIHTVDEGIALLTGQPAGERDADGQFPPDSVNGRAQAKLEQFARTVREFQDAPPGDA